MLIIKEAWRAYRYNASSFLIAQFLIFVVSLLITLIGLGILLNSLGISSFLEILRNPELLPSRVASLLPTLTGIGIAILFFIASFLVGVYLSIGVYGMAFESLRGKTRVESMFKFAKLYGVTGLLSFIISGIVLFFLFVFLIGTLTFLRSYLGVIVGLILFFLISIFFSLIFPPIIVDNMNSLEAIGKSFSIVKENYLEILVILLIFFFVISLLSFLPILGFLLNWFLIFPLLQITLILFYKRKK